MFEEMYFLIPVHFVSYVTVFVQVFEQVKVCYERTCTKLYKEGNSSGLNSPHQ